MYCEIPRLVRCCFCVPLRYGVLVYGYLNLIFSVMLLGLMSWICHDSSTHHGRRVDHITMPVHGALLETHIAVPMSLYCLEIIFNILLIIGSHKKNTMLLKIFYYYGLVTAVTTFIMFCLSMTTYYKFFTFYYSLYVYVTFFMCLGFCGLLLHGYLLLLVRSELVKLEENQRFRFVNLTAEVTMEQAPETAIYNPL